MVANWPLLAIRIAETVLLVLIGIAAAFAVIVPILVSIGFDMALWSSQPAADTAEQVLGIIAAHLLLIVYILVIVTLVLLVLVAIHSFVVAGCVRVYVDAEKKNARVALPPRSEFHTFSGDRWFEGGKREWWPVFWIYNIAWAVGGTLMLLPITILSVVVLLLRETPAAVIAIGCAGLMFSIVFMLLVAVVTNIWTQKGIVDCVARGTGANDSLRAAWKEIKTDAGRHIAVAAVMIAVTLAGSTVFSSFSWMGSLNHSTSFNIMLMPLQFSASIANGIFSAAVGAWFLASFAALAAESR